MPAERFNISLTLISINNRKTWSPFYSSENFFSNTHVSTYIQCATPEIPRAPLYLLYWKQRNALLTIGARFSNCCKFCNNSTIRNFRIVGISLEMCFASVEWLAAFVYLKGVLPLCKPKGKDPSGSLRDVVPQRPAENFRNIMVQLIESFPEFYVLFRFSFWRSLYVSS